jgi:hypothetical protein
MPVHRSDRSSTSLNHFLYLRHFLLLTGSSILLGILSRLHFLSDLSVSFALYGALHACALVFALRARHPIGQKYLFIAIAAGLSVLTLRAGVIGIHLTGTLPGNVGLYTVMGFSALMGAVTYGVSIRIFRLYELSPASIAVIAVGCTLATYIAAYTLAHSQFLGRWWLAVLWWYAFSGGLWYCDRRQIHGLSGERTCSGRTPRPRI